MKGRKAFTLFELLLILVLIVMIYQIISSYVQGSRIATNEAMAERVLSTLSMASESFSMNSGLYPQSETSLFEYMDRLYCGTTVSGYQFVCIFDAGGAGYTFTATPIVPGESGIIEFSIQTGGFWQNTP